ncbi:MULTISPECIES: outer membrane beta-barrel protein [unclassified Bartonella]|uniref:outer membrane beta-barrel protein n=1 Tax=unclassified Bartonella TaxID=2645622 RepID=UPI0035D039C2
MNTKRLITASIFSLISASTALAADVMIPHQPASSTASSSAIVAPTFSWTGLYLGVQAGGFSSKADMALVGQEKSLPLDKEFSPKLSGFVGGFYAGSNIDLGDNFIFGIDTDLMISGKKHTKTITIGAADNTTVENAVVRSRRSAEVVTTTETPVTPVARTLTSNTLIRSTVQSQPTRENLNQQPNPGVSQSGKKETTGDSNSTTVKETVKVEEKTLGVSNPTSASLAGQRGSSNPVTKPQTGAETATISTSKQPSSSTETRTRVQSELSLGRSDTGNQSSRVETKREDATAKSAKTTSILAGSSQVQSTSATPAVQSAVAVPAKSVVTKLTSSTPSTGTEASQPAAKAPTPVQSVSQSSAAEKTVPSSSLVLARSGSSSGSETKASNGTSGAQQGGHHSSSHGSGNANSHGASHAGGHGSGANPHASRSHGGQNMAGHGAQSTQAVDKNNSSVYGIEQIKKMASELGLGQEDEAETLNHTFKQNWGGATRVRIGFAADRFMPYLAGGIAYGQFQDTVSISVKDEDGRVVSSKNLADETKTMIGYTLGGGVDFSLLDNVIVRAEYRYSDFGKKKFAKEKLEVNYKTNDFRVGVAYKF